MIKKLAYWILVRVVFVPIFSAALKLDKAATEAVAIARGMKSKDL